MATASNCSYKIDFENIISNDNFIGKGSFGHVYGPCFLLNKNCAVKKRLFDKRTLSEETHKEIIACNKWKSLHHPNLIEVYDVNFEINALHVVMEYAKGGSLTYALGLFQSDLPYDIFRDWAMQISRGMNYLHDNSIVHRDLKSPNSEYIEHFNICLVSEFVRAGL